MPSITPPNNNETYDVFFSACRAKYMTEPKDSVYREPVTFEWMKSLKGGGKGGGTRVEFGVRLGSPLGNTDLTFGGTDTISPEEIEDTTIGIANYVEPYKLAKLSKDQILAAKGYAKYDYVKETLDNFISSWKRSENTNLWASSQDSKKVQSISVAVSTTTATGTLFTNLNRATYSAWRQTNQDAGGSPFTSVGLSNMRTLYWALSRGPNRTFPDTIFWDLTVQALWEQVTDAREMTEMATVRDGKKPIISEAAVFRGCRIYPEPVDYPNSTTLRMLTSSTWHYASMLEEMPGEPSAPVDGRWWAYPVGGIYTFWCDALRDNGLVSNFTAA